MGGHLILGGPGLLQALWAVAVPVGICTRKRQSGLWDAISLGLGSDRSRPPSAATPLQGPEASRAPPVAPSIHFHPAHRHGVRPSAVPCASAHRRPRAPTQGAAGPPRPLESGSGQASPGHSLTEEGVPLGTEQQKGSLTIGIHFQDCFLGLERRNPPGYGPATCRASPAARPHSVSEDPPRCSVRPRASAELTPAAQWSQCPEGGPL